MKKFRFSLETLLFLRREEEQESEIALAKAAGELKAIENCIDEARLAGDEAFTQEIRTLDDLIVRDRIWMKSVNDRKALEVSRKKVAGRFEEARKVYIEAHIRRNTLDRLKKKRFERHRKDMRREEIHHLDEAARRAVSKDILMGEQM